MPVTYSIPKLPGLEHNKQARQWEIMGWKWEIKEGKAGRTHRVRAEGRYWFSSGEGGGGEAQIPWLQRNVDWPINHLRPCIQSTCGIRTGREAGGERTCSHPGVPPLSPHVPAPLLGQIWSLGKSGGTPGVIKAMMRVVWKLTLFLQYLHLILLAKYCNIVYYTCIILTCDSRTNVWII